MTSKQTLRSKQIMFTCFKRFLSANKEYQRSEEYTKTLPVFDYESPNKERNRIYAWGSSKTGALGVRYIKQQKLLSTVRHPRRLGFGEKYNVMSVASGFGFTAFAVDSPDELKVYGTGLNTDSQIGCQQIGNKPLEFVFFPQPINIPFHNPKRIKIAKMSAGRAHLAVLTQDEGLFIMGNNAYGQCGRKIIDNESYVYNPTVTRIKNIEGKAIVDVVCGQDHTIARTEDGALYGCGWGADGQTGLGHYNAESKFTRICGDIERENIIKIACRSDFVIALNGIPKLNNHQPNIFIRYILDKGEVFGWGNTEYGQITTPDDRQQISVPTFIKSCQKLGKIVDVASGGSFCMVLNENRHVFVWGFGLLGAGPRVQQSLIPIQIPPQLFGLNDFNPHNYVASIECGLSHLAAVTTEGDLYIWGRNRECCLGLGTLNDQNFPLKVAIGGYVKQVSCGFDHTVAVCGAFTAG
ncbi:rcc1-like g exchanging factor-like protein [Holotrichia oblita]|uniref:Rcc1-like g exchanging factor-like protein n=1 Tax=Holotrichia oblita TaxID=644536 RepID=A0ACB9SMG8_HOLOL|nr:rcc1-like g exchanging factor-like protein [Holotrichia oblita]